MCGIAGLIDCDQPIDASVGKRMTDIVSYRGPDDEGFAWWGCVVNAEALPRNKTVGFPNGSVHLSEDQVRCRSVFLGHRRLSILDLSAAGHQPMVSGDGRFSVVFNGEIYNYRELRPELESEGYRFKSNCDTEVILAAYACWGERCLHRFNGMWGLAIYDAQKQSLFAARDRFGVKPFYYAVDGNRFGFGSEIKQLTAGGFGTGRAERIQVARLVVHQRIDADRETLFEGIQQLLPGEALEWNIQLGTSAIKPYRYYSASHSRDMQADGKLDQYRDEFRELLNDSVRLRLRSDVPVGTCLSGGLDSSSIVATVHKLSSNGTQRLPQLSFTSCFTDPRFDEWQYAQSMVEATGVESHRVFPDMDRLWEEMNDLIWHLDQPCTSTSAYAQWNVMRLAKQSGIKVLLDGQGADEVMAGYHYFLIDFLTSLGKQGSWRQSFKALAALHRTGLLSAARKGFASSLSVLIHTAVRRMLGIRPPSGWLESVTKPAFRMTNPDPRPRAFQDHLRWTLLTSLQQLLRYEDRNAMAFSIEARTPFLDYRLVELFLKMCGAYKIRDGWTKPFLREAFEGSMPETVRLRVDKKGFVTPESAWYLKHFDRIRKVLLSPNSPVHIWLDPAELDRKLDRKQFAAPRDFSLFRVLAVHFWMLRFSLQ